MFICGETLSEKMAFFFFTARLRYRGKSFFFSRKRVGYAISVERYRIVQYQRIIQYQRSTYRDGEAGKKSRTESTRIASPARINSDQLGSSRTAPKYGHRDIEKIVLLTWKCNSHKSTSNLFLVDRAPIRSGKARQDETRRAIFFSIIYGSKVKQVKFFFLRYV